VTLFFLVIDTAREELAWVRAGHDPAIVFDPDNDSFEEIGGSGMALGVDEKYIYGEQSRARPSKGRVIVLGTNGVWEASDLQGNRFGKKSVYDAVRMHHHRSASEILDSIFCAQTAFQGEAKKEDDATLVVIKIKK